MIMESRQDAAFALCQALRDASLPADYWQIDQPEEYCEEEPETPDGYETEELGMDWN